ncbi:hypothetical protein NPIL_240141 [Nephila pilipes]|uniref:Uncharacterized protein n=1 Tax=Nephila pilipes TaxID=299642 RepID=A0A8X6IJW0_NEPPI|nr:hypothetical protein NPIL_240141 [Nephila pilipes]
MKKKERGRKKRTDTSRFARMWDNARFFVPGTLLFTSPPLLSEDPTDLAFISPSIREVFRGNRTRLVYVIQLKYCLPRALWLHRSITDAHGTIGSNIPNYFPHQSDN